MSPRASTPSASVSRHRRSRRRAESSAPAKRSRVARAVAAASPGATALQVLTVIACERRTSSTQAPNRVLPDGNRFLQDVHEALRPLAERSGGAMALGDCSTLLEVRRLLPAAGPFLLQVVGHGSAGKLNLGRAWPLPVGVSSPTNLVQACAAELLVLNPLAQLTLSEVRLVGCDVGKLDGEPLLAAVSQLFGCDVTASRGEVSAAEFQGGLYAGPLQRFERAGLRYVR